MVILPLISAQISPPVVKGTHEESRQPENAENALNINASVTEMQTALQHRVGDDLDSGCRTLKTISEAFVLIYVREQVADFLAPG